MQARAISLTQFPVYQENAEAGNYHMLLWPQATASNATLWFNMSYGDEKYRTLFQDVNFRRAMSHAIDRDTLNQLVFLGQGVPRTETVVPDSACYVPELENVHGEYDVALSQSLLEQAGLVKGGDGFYTFADGSELLLSIETSNTEATLQDSLELISQWWNEAGVRTEVEAMTRDAYWPRATANEVMVATWTTDRGLVPMVDPVYQFPFDERSWMGPAMVVWYKTGGADGMEPTAEIREVMDLYDQYKGTIDPAAQTEICKQIVTIATDQVWTLGTVGLVPNPVVVKNNFMGVMPNHTADWIIMTPGTMDPAQFWFTDGDANQ
jgi:peptide/nickel transport system substrate-binding protein